MSWLEKVTYTSALLAAGLVGGAEMADTAWNLPVEQALNDSIKTTKLMNLPTTGACYVASAQKPVVFVERIDTGGTFRGEGSGITAFMDHIGFSSWANPSDEKIHALGNLPVIDTLNSQTACAALPSGMALTFGQAQQKLADAYNGINRSAAQLQEASPSARGEIKISSAQTPAPGPT